MQLGRGAAVLSMPVSKGIGPKCFKIAGSGQPGHPVHLEKDLRPLFKHPPEIF
ncbi:hypothetical protein SAMN02949497_1248 [Methylomagnum ishizawai]|uniref:Uncharacterized protein n=1 Tax=Methylomagnum ishizawai TaxID=1760988 RepID=A0A1Y6D061_9GAMM|nr:hypothetical protein SAMN02949497_1248 [Methylomagnum ishizawai]